MAVGRTLLLVTLGAALLWPASALAASGALVNGVMSYTADAGESNNVIFALNTTGIEDTFEVRDTPGVSIAPRHRASTAISRTSWNAPPTGTARA